MLGGLFLQFLDVGFLRRATKQDQQVVGAVLLCLGHERPALLWSRTPTKPNFEAAKGRISERFHDVPGSVR